MNRREVLLGSASVIPLSGCLRLQNNDQNTVTVIVTPESTSSEPQANSPSPTPTSRPTDTIIENTIVHRTLGLDAGDYADYSIGFPESGRLSVNIKVESGSKVFGILMTKSEFENFAPAKSGQYESIHQTGGVYRASHEIKLQTGDYVYVILASTIGPSNVLVEINKIY